jgi:hypothetical protein
MEKIKGREVRLEKDTDHSMAGRITHFLEFEDGVTMEDVLHWLKEQNWLGYNPAGYGATEVRPLTETNNLGTTRHWTYCHAASCD